MEIKSYLGRVGVFLKDLLHLRVALCLFCLMQNSTLYNRNVTGPLIMNFEYSGSST